MGGGQEWGAAGSRVGLCTRELRWEFFLDREGSGAGRKDQELWVWRQHGLKLLRGFVGSTSRYLILCTSVSDHGCEPLRTVGFLLWCSHSSVIFMFVA